MSDLALARAVTPRLWRQGLDRKLTYVLELPMPDSARFALHRPEFLMPLLRGETAIAALMKESRMAFESGTTLIESGTEHPFVYRLISGWAGRTRQLADGRNQFILIFLPGDLFAVKSLFVTRHTDSVQTLSKVVVERIHYQELYKAYSQSSEVALRCTWQVLEEERRLHSWVVGLGQGTAEERVALLLLDFRGRLALSGAVAADAQAYQMPMTQAQLADHLGITAVHVNRVLKSFRERGIVSVRDGKVTITDLDALSRHAAPLLDTYEKSTTQYVGHVDAPAES
jgi:CRP/FNR family transcriptional regulator, anaerobic regulatory protein